MDLLIDLKTELARWLDGNNLALVMFAAIAVQFGTALALRRRLSEWLPWVAALAVLIVNESASTLADRHVAPGEESRALRDILVGIAFPTFLMLAVRYRPHLFSSGPPSTYHGSNSSAAQEDAVDVEFEEVR